MLKLNKKELVQSIDNLTTYLEDKISEVAGVAGISEGVPKRPFTLEELVTYPEDTLQKVLNELVGVYASLNIDPFPIMGVEWLEEELDRLANERIAKEMKNRVLH